MPLRSGGSFEVPTHVLASTQYLLAGDLARREKESRAHARRLCTI